MLLQKVDEYIYFIFGVLFFIPWQEIKLVAFKLKTSCCGGGVHIHSHGTPLSSAIPFGICSTQAQLKSQLKSGQNLQPQFGALQSRALLSGIPPSFSGGRGFAGSERKWMLGQSFGFATSTDMLDLKVKTRMIRYRLFNSFGICLFLFNFLVLLVSRCFSVLCVYLYISSIVASE